MSDQKPDEATERQLTPEMEQLDKVLRMKLDRGVITEMQRAHGGVVRTFLRNCSVEYPEIEAALAVAAPNGNPKERSEVLYAALDHIVKSRC
jgi:hypothetical protein